MTRRIATAIVASLFAAVMLAAGQTVGAQSTPASQTPAPVPTVTLVGCIAKIPAAVAGTPKPAAPSGATHILTDAEAGGSSPVVARGATPPPSPPKPPMVVEHQYWLKTAVTTIPLAQHETHRVEVVGIPTVVQPAASPTGRQTTPPPTANWPNSLLTITSLKMLSTECKGR